MINFWTSAANATLPLLAVNIDNDFSDEPVVYRSVTAIVQGLACGFFPSLAFEAVRHLASPLTAWVPGPLGLLVRVITHLITPILGMELFDETHIERNIIVPMSKNAGDFAQRAINALLPRA